MLIDNRRSKLVFMPKVKGTPTRRHPVSPKGHCPGVMYVGEKKDIARNPLMRSANDKCKMRNSLGFSRRLGSLQNA